MRPGAARPAGRPATADPLAPLLDLPGVRDAAEAARTGIDRLLRHRLMRNRSAEVSTESALRGARASAALEGVDVPLADLRAGQVDDPVVQGALRASVALGSVQDTWTRAPGRTGMVTCSPRRACRSRDRRVPCSWAASHARPRRRRYEAAVRRLHGPRLRCPLPCHAP